MVSITQKSHCFGVIRIFKPSLDGDNRTVQSQQHAL
jgi:hypothetical protein